MSELGPDPRYSPPVLPAAQARALAKQHGLRRVGARPSLVDYTRDLWRYRHLMWSMAKGEFITEHRDNYLGLLWSIINPILLGVAYYLIFGVLLDLRRDVINFVSFLTIGLFTFSLFATALTAGSKSLLGKVGMMRSLAFPRVILPIVTVASAFVSNLPAFLVLLLIALFSGEPITLSWLLYPVALLIVAFMGAGLTMMAARLVHAVRDLANLVALVVRLLRYVSGVFFSIDVRIASIDGAPSWVGPLLEYQPVALALTLVRQTLMHEFPLQWSTWLAAIGWAVLLCGAGYLIFWRGEGTYGRA